jgi:hypothetical protein
MIHTALNQLDQPCYFMHWNKAGLNGLQSSLQRLAAQTSVQLSDVFSVVLEVMLLTLPLQVTVGVWSVLLSTTSLLLSLACGVTAYFAAIGFGQAAWSDACWIAMLIVIIIFMTAMAAINISHIPGRRAVSHMKHSMGIAPDQMFNNHCTLDRPWVRSVVIVTFVVMGSLIALYIINWRSWWRLDPYLAGPSPPPLPPLVPAPFPSPPAPVI